MELNIPKVEKKDTYEDHIANVVREMFHPLDSLAIMLENNDDDVSCVISALTERAKDQAEEILKTLEYEIGTIHFSRASCGNSMNAKTGALLGAAIVKKATD